MRGLADIFWTLQDLLPAWALVGLGVLVAAIVVPRMRRSLRDKQVRGLLRRAARAAPADRADLVDEAFEQAGDDLDALYSLAFDAHTRQLPDAHRRARAQLATHPRGRRLDADLQRRIGAPAHRGPTAFEHAASIRVLLHEGRRDEARVRLDQALAAFPSDPDLRDLDGSMARPPVDAPADGQ